MGLRSQKHSKIDRRSAADSGFLLVFSRQQKPGRGPEPASAFRVYGNACSNNVSIHRGTVDKGQEQLHDG